MDLTWFIIYTLLVLVVVAFVYLCFSDGDFLLMYYSKNGKELEKMKGQVVWITGASTGIGAALAVEFAKVGSKIVISARSKEKLDQVKKKCLEAGKPQGLKEADILVLEMDMCKFSTHKPCLEAILKRFSRLDVLVNNAGKSQRARWEHIEMPVDRDMFELNVFSLVNLTRLVIPQFEKQGGGTLAVTSSMAGISGIPFSGTYCGTKHAVHGYFNSLRTEKLTSNIDVVVLCPGPVFSNLLEGAATEKEGENFGGSMGANDKRMTAERCAFLMMVAIAHKLEEAWITFFPILPMMYAYQYLPWLTRKFIRLVGPSLFQKLRDSKETVKNK
ncbi:hypothetical protein TCAL_10578 [Tigriopus californicus]|uniref:Dehydrogenase/reductase SDR family member 7 n=1 Tax=Tigriopus californicus TaxID=6832 RepID=A0A553PK66_TIGCA|nr:dehydrogenase/reductase SDR family member 7-like [Tigriopus californicus]TRY78067.1 hypothetical protein TCAL_10578 [Tigriopus californicus]|eukprot:TCALIF_10578-PA protein Name:"Similar to DHRS7 Dehydrogenase/reductase SDR family member 7 (Homo sapiens)" AED:0.11 eAED:0.11 QI:161/1/1/1/1/1/7/136/329